MKEAYYFPHDYNARQDPKLMDVLMELGCEGIGIYWCIIEQMYEQGGTLPINSIKLIAYSLHVERESVQRLVDDFGLFEQDGIEFWSNAVRKRIKKRTDVSEKRRAAGIAGLTARWNKEANATQTDSKPIANATQTDSKSIAKNSKGNKIKENEIKVNNISLSLENKSDEAVAERERILEIFYFEKNCVDYFGEALKFIDHYEASGWCRKGSNTPVKNRLALARRWKVESAAARADPTALRWLRRVYDKIAETDPQHVGQIMRNVTTVIDIEGAATATFEITCKNREVASYIETALQTWPGLSDGRRIIYKVPKTNNT